MSSQLASNVSLEETEGECLEEKEDNEEEVSSNSISNINHHLAGLDEDEGDYFSGLPNVLIVTGVPESVYDDEEEKNQFELLFKEFDSMAEFFYLKAFRRARIVFDFPRSATRARICLHERSFHGAIIKCYFAQPVETNDPSSYSQFLLPPKPEKQFLISPPCSPPDGWEPVNEKQPTINYELIAAITNLAAGESHEIRAASESVPGIVVHVCEDPEGVINKPQIVPTKCPNTTS